MCERALCVCLHLLPLVFVPHFSSFHHGYSTLTQIFSTSLWSLTFNVFFHWLSIMWVMEEVKLILLLHSLQVTEDECQTKCPQCNTETGLTLAGSFYCSLSDVHQLKKAFQKHPEYSAVTDTNWIKQKIKKNVPQPFLLHLSHGCHYLSHVRMSRCFEDDLKELLYLFTVSSNKLYNSYCSTCCVRVFL